MRHWLLIFMIALLPLRGWTAGTMAGQMPEQHAAGAAMTAVAHDSTAMMPDCAEHAAAPASEADTSAGQASADCHTCASCQICHTVAATVNAALPALTFPANALPLSGGARFASAQPAQSLKPPIS